MLPHKGLRESRHSAVLPLHKSINTLNDVDWIVAFAGMVPLAAPLPARPPAFLYSKRLRWVVGAFARCGWLK